MSTLPPTSTNARFEPALGCENCFARNECGGLYTPGVIGCFCLCCNEPEICTYLCPRSKNFPALWRDTGGVTITTNYLRQDHTTLPAYLPLIQHGNKRTTPLKVPWAALTTFDVTRRDKRLDDMIRDPDRLRDKFRLEHNTAVVLSSVAPDNELERYWYERTHRHLVDGIKAIRPTHVIAPNFSLFRDVPRFDNLGNIKRSVLCAEEFSKAGLSVIPYLAGITAHDWQRWADFLREHDSITLICKEFQTGGRNKAVGDWHIQRLHELQERLGRALHIIAVAGRRHHTLQTEAARLTIIDSNPFMRTMHRQRLTTIGWEKTPTPVGAPLDELLHHNITAYANSLGRVQGRLKPHKRPQTTITQTAEQLLLWPIHSPDSSAAAA